MGCQSPTPLFPICGDPISPIYQKSNSFLRVFGRMTSERLPAPGIELDLGLPRLPPYPRHDLLTQLNVLKPRAQRTAAARIYCVPLRRIGKSRVGAPADGGEVRLAGAHVSARDRRALLHAVRAVAERGGALAHATLKCKIRRVDAARSAADRARARELGGLWREE